MPLIQTVGLPLLSLSEAKTLTVICQMLATLRLCLFYSQAAICLRTDLQWKVFPLVICASLLRHICKQATAKSYSCGTNREIFNGWFLCYTWAQNPVTPRRTIFSNRLETVIYYFWICYFSSCIHSVLQFLNSCPLLFAKGHLPSSSPVIKCCSEKPILMQWGVCTAFVYCWPVNVTMHSFCIRFTPLLFLSQTAPGPGRMAESDSDSAQLSTNSKLSQ